MIFRLSCFLEYLILKVPKGKTLLPVMVYIHGGAFEIGSSDSRIYGPDFFMREEVVLVTINYRLGVFGK